MASTILEQILENIERGATIPLSQEQTDTGASYSEEVIHALEAEILAALDLELDRLVDQLAAVSCPTADVRREVREQLKAVADAHLQSFAHSNQGTSLNDLSNLGSEAALMQASVPAVGSALEFDQEGEAVFEPVAVLASGEPECEINATDAVHSSPDAPTQTIPREAPAKRATPAKPVKMTDIQAMIDQLI